MGPYAGVRRIIKLMTPVIFGSSVAQINILFDTLIASFLAAGSISWLYYADRLMEFPLGVFGIALATAILPTLSEQHARASPEAFSNTLDWALRLVLVIAFPAALGLIVLARPLLATIFFGGEFTGDDVAMAGAALVAYGLGLVGFILVKVLTPGYFARQDTRSPVRIAVYALGLNMALNVVLVVSLIRADYYAPHAGLAMATTLSALFNAGLLYRGLRRRGVYTPQPGWGTAGDPGARGRRNDDACRRVAPRPGRRLAAAGRDSARRRALHLRRSRHGHLLLVCVPVRPAVGGASEISAAAPIIARVTSCRPRSPCSCTATCRICKARPLARAW